MMLHFASFLVGNVVLIIGHINAFSTNFLNSSTNAYSATCSGVFSELIFDNYTLDFDSTVIVREGNQEGAAKGMVFLIPF